MELIPPVNDAGRLKTAMEIISRLSRPENAFISGDRALLYPFKEHWTAQGADEKKIKIECFFNNPFKKIAA